ncbi:hypothetical protein [Paludisphaera mucosa]|uniref:Uncharacterized protein n=1 Tax=Paludisphaera mucosa TaxID=3030827 RepID=A0ABT6F3N9_9BACT|nr:hypothetical protein [Paludisphaera mucosa]MDG3002165.1 hypothetical protein [Paludisphaera mucosa]
MLAPLVCLLGLTLVGQDGPSVTAVVRAPGPWAASFLGIETARPSSAATSSTPLDDEVEEFPDEPEGDDEEDPGEAMGSKGRSPASILLAGLSLLDRAATPPPPPSWAALPAPPRGSPLSLLGRLRF